MKRLFSLLLTTAARETVLHCWLRSLLGVRSAAIRYGG
jgi:hypothetical protein